MTRLIQKGTEGILMYSVDLLKSSLVLADLPLMYELADVAR